MTPLDPGDIYVTRRAAVVLLGRSENWWQRRRASGEVAGRLVKRGMPMLYRLSDVLALDGRKVAAVDGNTERGVKDGN